MPVLVFLLLYIVDHRLVCVLTLEYRASQGMLVRHRVASSHTSGVTLTLSASISHSHVHVRNVMLKKKISR